ncbi:MAG: type II toxin-antitoxin system RelE/ParE family toxin [Telmatospirillum sp.]|nr:type II toxin-antitoxin system RelE/ParE family toxin [Telmatospirillum sp.]
MAGEPVRFAVLLTQSAARDVEAVYEYLCESDSEASADKVVAALDVAIESLAKFPARGSPPKELLGVGMIEYRQILVGPYRVIYRVADRRVIVYLIADGRRDMRSLLVKRLLGG